MQFYSVDTLTGKVVGELEPTDWSITDPLKSPGTGTLTLPLPTDVAGVARLAEATQPQNRWVVMLDGSAAFGNQQILWCGPIANRPGRDSSAGTVVVSVADWRSWFYKAPLRPNADGSRTIYSHTGAGARDQTTICTDLMTLALSAPGVPPMVVDSAPVTGTTQELVVQMLDTSMGKNLDDVAAVGSFDWNVYATRVDATHFQLHAEVCWPERAFRSMPVLLEWVVGRGGNVASYAWPSGQDAPTKVWAVGSNTSPAQIFASDEVPDIADGTGVLWEEIITVDNAVSSASAFRHASAELDKVQGFNATADFTLSDEQLALTDVATGDRAHVRLYDGWNDVDVTAARITSRTMAGGRNKALTQQLTVDLSDVIYPDIDPGTDVSDDV